MNEGMYYAVYDVQEDGKKMLGISAEVCCFQDGTIMARIWDEQHENEQCEHKYFQSIRAFSSVVGYDRLVPMTELFPQKQHSYHTYTRKEALSKSVYNEPTVEFGDLDDRIHTLKNLLHADQYDNFKKELEFLGIVEEYQNSVPLNRLLEILIFVWSRKGFSTFTRKFIADVEKIQQKMSVDALFCNEEAVCLVTLEEVKNYLLANNDRHNTWKILHENEDNSCVFINTNLGSKLCFPLDDVVINVDDRLDFFHHLADFELGEDVTGTQDQKVRTIIFEILLFNRDDVSKEDEVEQDAE